MTSTATAGCQTIAANSEAQAFRRPERTSQAAHHPAHCRPQAFGETSAISRKRQCRGMRRLSFDLLINAIIAGLLLGGFYAAVTVGVSISFGILDIVNIAHPAFIILGSYIAYIVNADARRSIRSWPASSCCRRSMRSAPAVYQVYYVSFEKRGQEALRGLAFFFGLLFITEVDADPGVRRRLPLRRGGLYRTDLALRLHRSAAAHAGPVRGLAAADRPCCSSICRAPSSAAPSWRWRRTSSRCS